MLKVTLAILVLVVAACGTAEDESTTTATVADTTAPVAAATTTTESPETTTSDTAASQAAAACAHVVDATIEASSRGFTIAATVASNDTGWEKYADAWQVWGPEGSVLGERILAHPHENEQPFTRRLNDVQIPGDVAEVTIAARDLVLGFCGDVLLIEVPHP